MTSTNLLIGAAAVILSTAYILVRPRRSPTQPQPDTLPSALLPSYTSHARLLPTPSKHAFSYPLLYIGADIDALEHGQLDLPARLFRYGGWPWTKVLGLRSAGYLTPGPLGLRDKLEKLLRGQGMSSEQIHKAWIVTMPSLLGFEGINPLTVWFVYDSSKRLSCVVLEVHNTFGEKHAYVLQTESSLNVSPNDGYDDAWVFPRTFHVSPFNSRNGYYRLDLLDPFPCDRPYPAPSPQYKVFLRLLTPDKTTKLTAVVASHPTHLPVPLRDSHIPSIVFALCRWPMTLFLTASRVVYNAYILQYLKKLAMFPRPEPRAQGQEGVWNPPQNYQDGTGLAIGWQDISGSEKWLERVFWRWAADRTRTTGISLHLHRPDYLRNDMDNGASKSDRTVHVTTSHPYFFTQLCMAPTARHFLALAPEIVTTVSDPDLFIQFLTIDKGPDDGAVNELLYGIQRSNFAWYSSVSAVSPSPDLWIYPQTHFVYDLPVRDKWWLCYVLYTTYLAARAEELIMRLISARFVAGGEPWKVWERALKRQYRERTADTDMEDWTVVGSVQY